MHNSTALLVEADSRVRVFPGRPISMPPMFSGWRASWPPGFLNGPAGASISTIRYAAWERKICYYKTAQEHMPWLAGVPRLEGEVFSLVPAGWPDARALAGAACAWCRMSLNWRSPGGLRDDIALNFAGRAPNVIKVVSTEKPKASDTLPEKPVLVEAINLTYRTMERRTRLYRNLVVCVSLTLFGSLVLALIFRKWVVLTGWLATPLFVGCFYHLDTRTIRAWRDGVLALRDKRGLDVMQLEQTLAAMRYIPAATLRSMFITLNIEEPET